MWKQHIYAKKIVIIGVKGNQLEIGVACMPVRVTSILPLRPRDFFLLCYRVAPYYGIYLYTYMLLYNRFSYKLCF
jgi:hypothetical protein